MDRFDFFQCSRKTLEVYAAHFGRTLRYRYFAVPALFGLCLIYVFIIRRHIKIRIADKQRFTAFFFKYLPISFPASLSTGLQPGDIERRVANPP